MILKDVLKLSPLNEFTCLAGNSGLDRTVNSVSVMDAPDIADWMKGGEILITTGYVLRDNPSAFAQLIEALANKGVAALAVKLKRFHDNLPPEVLATADRFNLPLLNIPYGLAWVDIIEPVLTALHEERTQKAATTEAAQRRLLSALRNGPNAGIPVDVVSELVDCPVALFDVRGTCLACSRGVTDEMLDRIQGREGLERAADLVVMPVESGPNHCGYLVCRGDASHVPVDLLREVLPILAYYMQAQGGVLSVRNKVIADLLEGNVAAPDRVSMYLKTWGWDATKDGMVLLVEPALEMEKSAYLSLGTAADLQRFGIIGWPVPMGRNLALVLNTGDDTTAFRELARSLFSTYSKGLVRRAVYGRAGKGLSSLTTSYLEATHALDVACRLGLSGFFGYRDLGVYRILAPHTSDPAFAQFVYDTLGSLSAIQDGIGDSLLTTLTVWLDCNGNLAKAARKLHLHYNTLLYRMQRIKEILGTRLDNAEERLILQIALRIKRLLNEPEPNIAQARRYQRKDEKVPEEAD